MKTRLITEGRWVRNIAVYILGAVIALSLPACSKKIAVINFNQRPILSKTSGSYQTLKKIQKELTFNGKVLMDEFRYKVPVNSRGDSVIIINKTPSYLYYYLDTVNLRCTVLRDSVYIKPNGSLKFELNEPLLIRKSHISAKVYSAYIDTVKNSLIVRVRYSSIRFHLKKANLQTAEAKFPKDAFIKSKNSVEINYMSFTQTLDKVLKNKGNLGNCENTLYWRGHTKILRVEENKLVMESKVTKSFYTCGKNFWRKWRMKISPNINQTIKYDVTVVDDHSGGVDVKVHVQDIYNFPGSLEKMIRKKLSRELNFGIPGFHTKIKSLKFAKLNENSIKVLCEFELE